MKFLPVNEFEKRQKSINFNRAIMNSAKTKIGYQTGIKSSHKFVQGLKIILNYTQFKESDVIDKKRQAIKLKDDGTAAFKKKKYEVAEKLYSEGLEMNLDSRPLWTNRAICRNRMGKYEDALVDSLSALSIDPKCTKERISN